MHVFQQIVEQYLSSKMNALRESPSNGGLLKRWWRIGCSMHVEDALHCHEMGRLLPRVVQHHNLNSLPKFNFNIHYLEEDRSDSTFDPFGNVRFYIEFHKFLSHFGNQLRIYLIDEFVENTKSISRILITKRSAGTLPLSLKKVDLSQMTGTLFHNQVSIVNSDGFEETLDHYLHVVTESSDDTNRWLFLHCIRRPINHKISQSLLRERSTDETVAANKLQQPETSSRNRSRRSSFAHSESPMFRDSKFTGDSCYLSYCEKKPCPSPYSIEKTRKYMNKVRRGFFRQMDLDFII